MTYGPSERKLCPLCKGVGQPFWLGRRGQMRPLPCKPCGSQGWLLVRFAREVPEPPKT